jgi:hypothetical protein
MASKSCPLFRTPHCVSAGHEKGQSHPVPIFHAAIQTMLRNLERPTPVHIGEFGQPICKQADCPLPPQMLWDGGCRGVRVKVVMVTHGTSRFKSCPENRDRHRLACELRASWKCLVSRNESPDSSLFLAAGGPTASRALPCHRGRSVAGDRCCRLSPALGVRLVAGPCVSASLQTLL